MGFDYVNFKTNCPKCGKEVSDFQTKDLSNYFSTVEIWQCDNFYSSCDYCHTWIEFNLKRTPEITINNFKMTYEITSIDESRFLRNKEGKIVSVLGKKEE